MRFIDFEEFGIPTFLVFLVIASVLMLIGIDIGMGIGKLECKKEYQKIHREMGIEMIMTTIGDKTTYSYRVIDCHKEDNK